VRPSSSALAIPAALDPGGPGVLRRIARNRLGLLGLIVALGIIFVAIFAGDLAPYPPRHIDIDHMLEGPSAAHPLGTDQLGRDTLSRLIAGTRTAISVALLAIGLAVTVGMALGLLAGYGPKLLDMGLLLMLDTLSSLPMMMFALALISLAGRGVGTVVGVIALFSIPGYARLIRSQTLSLRQADFILAERSMGASLGRILFVHLMPNVIAPILVVISMDVPVVIGLDAGLSFLGIGMDPSTPSWGSALNDGFVNIRITPLLVIVASLPIVVATLGFTFLSEALREALDPKLQDGR
jgi:peptide/nickel transport system permease protein